MVWALLASDGAAFVLAGRDTLFTPDDVTDVLVEGDTLFTSDDVAPDRDILRRMENRAFGVGERLVYSIEYGPVNAGKAVLEVAGLTEIEGRLCYHVTSDTRSNRAFSVFYKIQDRVETFIDVAGIFPWRLEKHLQEGTSTKNVVVTYDQVNQVAMSGTREIEIPPFVQDVVSVFYFIRTQEFEVGDSLAVDTQDGKKVYPLELKVLRKEQVTLKAGTFDCLVVEPRLRGQGGLLLFRKTGKMVVWFTDDQHKMPVLIQSKIPVGAIEAELTEYRLGDGFQAHLNEKGQGMYPESEAP